MIAALDGGDVALIVLSAFWGLLVLFLCIVLINTFRVLESTKLIIDCSGVTYMSSMGLGTLVRVHARMKKLGGDVKLAAVQGPVAQVMQVVFLHRIFQMYPTLEEAIAAHGG